MIPPPHWTSEEFERDRARAIAAFRHIRLEEPLEAYLEVFDRYQGIFEDLMETTVDLTELRDNGLQVLTDEKLLEAFRYLAGPPISKDDLKVVAEASSISKKRLRDDPELVQRIIELVYIALDKAIRLGGRESGTDRGRTRSRRPSLGCSHRHPTPRHRSSQ